MDGCNRKPLVIFGHTARIWDCQFVDQYLVSISEVIRILLSFNDNIYILMISIGCHLSGMEKHSDG